MAKVCIHYPIDPKMAKECMSLRGHDESCLRDLELPFADDEAMFKRALSNLIYDGIISEQEGLDSVKKARENRDRNISPDPVQNLSRERTDRLDSLNLNDPRISEIHIKYRDWEMS